MAVGRSMMMTSAAMMAARSRGFGAGRAQRATGSSTTIANSAALTVGLRRALSPTFRAGAMVFFIPWRVVAEESGAAHFGFGGAMLLDLPGPALRLLTDVADFHFSDIAVRGDDGARAIGANDDAAAVELRGRRRQHP
jgi:hypothetical protein